MLRLEVVRGVARLTLDRPEKRNALSPQMLRELIGRCAEIAADDAVRAVILQGSSGCFSGGADLMAFFPELQGPNALAAADLGRQAAMALAGLEVPVVAVVDGVCVGGGVVLSACCDLVIGSDRARFRVPEVALGVPLAWGGTTRLVQRIGPVATADLVMTCRWVEAEEAQRLGLVSRVVPADQLGGVVDDLVADLVARPRRTMAVTKRQIRAAVTGEPCDELDAEALVAALSDPETLAAAQAYLAGAIGR